MYLNLSFNHQGELIVRLKSIIITILVATSSITSFAYAQTASKQSVKELIKVMQLRNQVDKMFDLMEQDIAKTYEKMGLGLKLQKKDAQQLNQTSKKLAQIMREEMSWEKIQKIYVKVYQENLTQEEVDGLIDFYRTPVGQSVLDKMPRLAKSSMQAVQRKIMPSVMPRIIELMKTLRNNTKNSEKIAQ